MAAKKIRALIREPGQEARIEEIEDDWKAYSALVGGGFIETISMPGMKDVRAVINDEGKLIGLPPNIYLPEYEDMLVGPVVFVSPKGDVFTGLTDAQIEKVKAYITLNDASGFAGKMDEYIKTEFHTFDGPDGKDEFLKFLFGGDKRNDVEM